MCLPQYLFTMTLDPQHIYRRQSLRIPDFDYGSGYVYYVTICVQEKKRLFGEIKNSKMTLNDSGEMIVRWWKKLPEKFPGISVDRFVVMPNHLHGIIHNEKATNISLSKIMQWFKTMTTNEYIRRVTEDGWQSFSWKLWQRNYYEHIIRDESDYYRICGYIEDNPKNWGTDENYVTEK